MQSRMGRGGNPVCAAKLARRDAKRRAVRDMLFNLHSRGSISRLSRRDAMGGNTCYTRDICDCYDDLVDEFESLGNWWGPNGDAPVTYLSLRTWWSNHGCIRCFLDAYERYYGTGEWRRVCLPSGNNYRMGNPEIVPKMQAAIKKWKDPGSRLPDRFYCGDCVQPLQCGSMLHTSLSPAVGIGHTGWFYQVPKAWKNKTVVWLYDYPPDGDDTGVDVGDWRVGEKVWGPHIPGVTSGNAGREVSVTDDSRPGFVTDIRNYGYAAYKLLWSRDGNFEEAFLTALQWLNTPYIPFPIPVNNCNQATHAVLSAFGADLIPSSDDKNFGMYTPGMYFDAIRVKAVYFPPAPSSEGFSAQQVISEPAARKAMKKSLHGMLARHRKARETAHRNQPPPCTPATVENDQGAFSPGGSRSAKRARKEAESVGVDAVYTIGPRSALHLTMRCPALESANEEPEEFAVPFTEDFRSLEEEFEARICGTCLQMIAAGPRIKKTLPTKSGCIHFCNDRIRTEESKGEMEILHERMTDHKRARWSATITIYYRIPLPNGCVADRTFDLKFETAEDCDACAAELDFLSS